MTALFRVEESFLAKVQRGVVVLAPAGGALGALAAGDLIQVQTPTGKVFETSVTGVEVSHDCFGDGPPTTGYLLGSEHNPLRIPFGSEIRKVWSFAPRTLKRAETAR